MTRYTLPLPSSPPAPWPLMMHTPHPHTCPVCGGRGTVPAGFYIGPMVTNTMRETCRACGGRGFVVA